MITGRGQVDFQHVLRARSELDLMFDVIIISSSYP